MGKCCVLNWQQLLSVGRSVGVLMKLPLTLPCLYVTSSAAICLLRLAITNSRDMSRVPCPIMTAGDSKVVAVVDQEALN